MAKLLARSEVVRIVELDAIPMAESGDDLRFRVEVLQRNSIEPRFVSRVWRIETYRIQPTFPQHERQLKEGPGDERILVWDFSAIDEVSGDSADAVLDEAIRRIEERFT